MRTATLRAKFKTSPLAAPNGARKAEFPTYIEPCDPTLRQRAPAGEDWVYEIKADGYRAQLHLEDTNATVYSRTGLNWTNQFSAIAEAATHLKVQQAVLDGEAVVYGTTGIPDFQALRRELGKKASGRLRYHAFDLLHLDGYDLRNVPAGGVKSGRGNAKAGVKHGSRLGKLDTRNVTPDGMMMIMRTIFPRWSP